MADFIEWPPGILRPAAVMADAVPFSRSGGTTLGGLTRSTRTDKGRWSIGYKGIQLSTGDRRRMWNAIRTYLSGAAGLVAVPVWSYDLLPWPAGAINGRVNTTHSDGTTFDDGSSYGQSAFVVEMAEAAAIDDVSVVLRVVSDIADLTGLRFSYQHALYEIGIPTAIDGDEWTVPIFPAIRAAIPEDAELEFGLPTCLVHLAGDREMDVSFTAGDADKVDVSFTEAVDYWNDLATAEEE